MRKIASNIIYVNGKRLINQTVTLDDDGWVVDIHPLREETSMTEWLSGAIVVTDSEEVIAEIERTRSLAEVPPLRNEAVALAVHISDVDLENDGLTETSAFGWLKG